MRVIIHLLTGILLSLCMTSLVGQNVANNAHIASSSQTSSVASTSENLSTGSMSTSIPIYELELENSVTLPIALNYSSGNGLPVRSRNGWVGMGWNLSGTYAVNRSIRGADDFQYVSDGFLFHHGFFKRPINDNSSTSNSTYALGIDDSEPDMFTVNLIGQQVSFYLVKVDNESSKWQTIPANSDIKIEFSLGEYDTMYDDDGVNVNRFNSSFIITDALGYRYYFGGSEFEEYSNTYNIQHEQSTNQKRLFATKWYVEKIETPFTNQIVSFTYEDEWYDYLSGSSSVDKSIRHESEAGSKCPNSIHYADFESSSNYTYVRGKRLSSISYHNQEIRFIADELNRGHHFNEPSHGLPSTMLNYIEVRSNDICTKKIGFDYYDLLSFEDIEWPFEHHISLSNNNYFLEKLVELPCTSLIDDGSYGYHNSLAHRFTYIRQYELQNVGRYCYDFWGYNNGKNTNQSPIPNIYELNGNQDCESAPTGDRSSDINYMVIGLLDTIFIPTGGFTAFEYEENIALSNANEETYLDSISGHVNWVDVDFDYDCELPDGSGGGSGTLTKRYSEWEFDYIQAPSTYLKLKNLGTNLYDQYCEGDWFPRFILYVKVNGQFQEVSLGSNDLTINMSERMSGRYKIKYLSTANSNIYISSISQVSEMSGAGIRLKSKLISDNDDNETDDIHTYYTYYNGRWGYSFLPSIYGYLNNSSPLIPAISDGNIEFDAQRSVISTLDRSIFKSFTSPIYYESVEVCKNGVGGYTEYTFSTPKNIDHTGRNRCDFYNNTSGEPDLLNQKQVFIKGQMSSYHINNGLESDQVCYDEYTSPFLAGKLLTTTVYDKDNTVVHSSTNEYEEVETGEHIFGVVCERYIKNRKYGFFFNNLQGAEWTTISRPYKVNTNTNRIKKVITSVDGITSEMEYSYSGNNKNVSTMVSTTIGRESDAVTQSFYYAEDLDNGPLRSLLLSKNCVSITLEVSVERNAKLIDGSKVDYLYNNGQLVKNIDYRVEGGEYIADMRYSNWDIYGRPLSAYQIKLGADITQDLSNAPDNHYNLPTISKYKESNHHLIESVTVGHRSSYFDYYPNERLKSMTTADGKITEFSYDELGRQNRMASADGQDELLVDYYFNPDAIDSYIKSTTKLEGSDIDDQISVQRVDGLNRNTVSLLENYHTDGSDFVKSFTTYDNGGKISTISTPGMGILAFKYSDSPLQRSFGQLKSHDDTNEIYESYIEYGSNDQIISIDGPGNVKDIYPIGTLLKETQIDIDGRTTIQYENSHGSIVRMAKINNGAEVNTDSYYNNRGLLELVSPHEGGAYQYTYHPDTDLLISKSIPGANGEEKYWYNNLKQLILVESTSGRVGVSIYDDYQRVIKTGAYNQATPSLGEILINPIPENHYYKGSEIVFTGDYNELSYIAEEHTAILGESTSLHSGNEISSTNSHLTKSYTYDSNNRLFSEESNSHFGTSDIYTYAYNSAGLIKGTVRTHTDPSDVSHVFNYRNHYDSKFRSTGLSLNNQRVSKIEYDRYGRMGKKKLHQTDNDTDSYTQTIDYSYDGYGRLIGINDLSDFDSADATPERYCDVIINLSDEQEIIINDLMHFDGVSEVMVSGIGFPVPIDQGDESSINAFIQSLETLLVAEGYIFDDILYNYNGGHPNITITQSNAQLTQVTVDGNVRKVERANCCSSIDEVDLFAQRLTYDRSLISVNEWQTSTDPLSSYHYHYDDLGRLTFANYSHRNSYNDSYIGDALDDIDAVYNHTNQSGRYSTSYTYDVIGNFSNLTRNSKAGNNLIGLLIDNLNYYYNTNSNSLDYGRLMNVSDLTNSQIGFDGVSGNVISGPNNPGTPILMAEYSYDASGNVIGNTGKNLSLTYNYFNRPTQLSHGNNSVDMIYDAAGVVLRKSIDGQKSFTQDFAADLEYRDNQLFAINYGEGRILLNYDGVELKESFEYVIRDYKGNPRVRFVDVINDDVITVNEIVSTHNYYPYGLKWDVPPSSSPNSSFETYQSMDWLEDANVYLTQYRVLDPEIGRWLQVDPMAAGATTQNPYNSMGLNPVMFSDQNGDSVIGLAFTIISIAATVIEGAKLIHNIRAYNAAAAMNHAQQLQGGLVFLEWVFVTGVTYAITYGVPKVPIKGISEGAIATKSIAKNMVYVGKGLMRATGKYIQNFTRGLVVSLVQNELRDNGLYQTDKSTDLKSFLGNVAVSALTATVVEIGLADTMKARARKSQVMEDALLMRFVDEGVIDDQGHAEIFKFVRASKRLTNTNNVLKLVHESWKLVGSLGTGWRYATHNPEVGDGENLANFNIHGPLFLHFFMTGPLPIPSWGGHVFDQSSIPGEWKWAQSSNWLNFTIGK